MFQLFSCYIFNFFQVISALEHLEALSGERDAERSTIDSLQTQVKHLELEDSKKMEERQRNAKELEQGMTKMAAHLKEIGQGSRGGPGSIFGTMKNQHHIAFNKRSQLLFQTCWGNACPLRGIP